MKRFLITLLAPILLITGCNNNQIHMGDGTHKESLNIVLKLKKSSDSVFSNLLSKNADLVKITNLYDYLIFSYYSISVQYVKGSDSFAKPKRYFNSHYTLLYKNNNLSCWSGVSIYEPYNVVELDDEFNIEKGFESFTVSPYSADENGYCKAVGRIFYDSQNDYESTYGFANKSKKQIISFYNKSGSPFYCESGSFKYLHVEEPIDTNQHPDYQNMFFDAWIQSYLFKK